MGDLVVGFEERREKQLAHDDYMEAKFYWKHHEGYILLKDEGYSFWYECPVCGMKFESDLGGMNAVNVITEGTGPTGKGRTAHWEPACPKCFRYEDIRE